METLRIKEQYDMKYYGIEKDGQVGITVDNKVMGKGKLAGGRGSLYCI